MSLSVDTLEQAQFALGSPNLQSLEFLSWGLKNPTVLTMVLQNCGNLRELVLRTEMGMQQPEQEMQRMKKLKALVLHQNLSFTIINTNITKLHLIEEMNSDYCFCFPMVEYLVLTGCEIQGLCFLNLKVLTSIDSELSDQVQKLNLNSLEELTLISSNNDPATPLILKSSRNIQKLNLLLQNYSRMKLRFIPSSVKELNITLRGADKNQFIKDLSRLSLIKLTISN